MNSGIRQEWDLDCLGMERPIEQLIPIYTSLLLRSQILQILVCAFKIPKLDASKKSFLR